MDPCRANEGLVVLLGAGPGDPDLITAAGLKWLSRADVIVYDRLVPQALLSLAPASAERLYVGKTPGAKSISQQQINDLLVARARAGKLVVRLKGGDPLIFGRGGEEAEALAAAGAAFRIVPGITAGVAAAAAAGIPLTDRRAASTVAFVTAREDPGKGRSAINWQGLAGIDTLVVYMGVAALPAVAERLIAAGRSPTTPAAAVEQAATARQRTVVATLGTIAERAQAAGLAPPAVVIVGQVVRMRDQLAWLERLPLFGQTVILTRPQQQAADLAGRLGELGAEAIEAPVIEIRPPESLAALDEALGRLGEFDWLVLTSPNGAAAVLDRLAALELDARALAGVRIAAVGAATADALRKRSIRPDLLPQAFTTEALGRALAAGGAIKGRRVLLARSEIATDALAAALQQAGAVVEAVVAYRTVRPEVLPAEAVEALRDRRVDWLTFTSASTVENFLALLAPHAVDLSQAKLAAIGPVTAKALRSRGLTATVVAEPHTVDGLVAAIVSFQAGGRS